nr:MAG TPA: Single strand binding protein [Caudoviricetes sp.]
MINKAIIMGRLTADPELKQTQSGIACCQFTVAVNRDYAPQGQERQADFISVVAWRQTAEFISKYFSKGKMIAIDGELRTRTYDDRRYPDVKHYVTEVYANKVSFCESKGAQSDVNAPQAAAAPQGNTRPANVQSAVRGVAQPSFDSRGGIDLGDFEEVIGNDDLPF